MPYLKGSGRTERGALSSGLVAGGFTLSFLAGFVNASLLAFYDVPVSHMSGAATRLGIDLGTNQHEELITLLGIISSFFCGAVVSGCIIGRHRLIPDRRYTAVLLLEALALALSGYLLTRDISDSLYAASFACGMQNAMASSYYGLIIRTTHMTGIVTDLGAMLGHFLRHRRGDPWKFLLLLTILCGFIVGAVSSVGVGQVSPVNRLYLAAGLAGLIMIGYQTWLLRGRPQAV